MGPYESPYEGMSDNAVIEKAREIYQKFQELPRWSPDNDRLLTEWGSICSELSRRGISDGVTEGGPTGLEGVIEMLRSQE
jgi:hypothetical protein